MNIKGAQGGHLPSHSVNPNGDGNQSFGVESGVAGGVGIGSLLSGSSNQVGNVDKSTRPFATRASKPPSSSIMTNPPNSSSSFQQKPNPPGSSLNDKSAHLQPVQPQQRFSNQYQANSARTQRTSSQSYVHSQSNSINSPLSESQLPHHSHSEIGHESHSSNSSQASTMWSSTQRPQNSATPNSGSISGSLKPSTRPPRQPVQAPLQKTQSSHPQSQLGEIPLSTTNPPIPFLESCLVPSSTLEYLSKIQNEITDFQSAEMVKMQNLRREIRTLRRKKQKQRQQALQGTHSQSSSYGMSSGGSSSHMASNSTSSLGTSTLTGTSDVLTDLSLLPLEQHQAFQARVHAIFSHNTPFSRALSTLVTHDLLPSSEKINSELSWSSSSKGNENITRKGDYFDTSISVIGSLTSSEQELCQSLREGFVPVSSLTQYDYDLVSPFIIQSHDAMHTTEMLLYLESLFPDRQLLREVNRHLSLGSRFIPSAEERLGQVAPSSNFVIESFGKGGSSTGTGSMMTSASTSLTSPVNETSGSNMLLYRVDPLEVQELAVLDNISNHSTYLHDDATRKSSPDLPSVDVIIRRGMSHAFLQDPLIDVSVREYINAFHRQNEICAEKRHVNCRDYSGRCKILLKIAYIDGFHALQPATCGTPLPDIISPESKTGVKSDAKTTKTSAMNSNIPGGSFTSETGLNSQLSRMLDVIYSSYNHFGPAAKILEKISAKDSTTEKQLKVTECHPETLERWIRAGEKREVVNEAEISRKQPCLIHIQNCTCAQTIAMQQGVAHALPPVPSPKGIPVAQVPAAKISTFDEYALSARYSTFLHESANPSVFAEPFMMNWRKNGNSAQTQAQLAKSRMRTQNQNQNALYGHNSGMNLSLPANLSQTSAQSSLSQSSQSSQSSQQVQMQPQLQHHQQMQNPDAYLSHMMTGTFPSSGLGVNK